MHYQLLFNSVFSLVPFLQIYYCFTASVNIYLKFLSLLLLYFSLNLALKVVQIVFLPQPDTSKSHLATFMVWEKPTKVNIPQEWNGLAYGKSTMPQEQHTMGLKNILVVTMIVDHMVLADALSVLRGEIQTNVCHLSAQNATLIFTIIIFLPKYFWSAF